MSAQIGDRFIYKDCEYTFVEISTPITFSPDQYGITPDTVSTICWKGFWCVYNISNEEIILRDLYVNAKDGNYPSINGVEASSEKNKIIYLGHHLYKDINIPIAFSGKILAGNNFLQKYYIHMGYQCAWGYERLVEFIFEEGVLMDVVDHSEFAAALRKKCDANADDFDKTVQDFMRCFRGERVTESGISQREIINVANPKIIDYLDNIDWNTEYKHGDILPEMCPICHKKVTIKFWGKYHQSYKISCETLGCLSETSRGL